MRSACAFGMAVATVAAAVLAPACALGAPSGHKLSLTIRCMAEPLRVGDEIPIEFHVKNEGDTIYTFMDRSYDRSGRMEEYRLIAVDAKGRPAPDPRANRPPGISGGLSTEGKLAWGHFFTKTIALNRWALLTKPGRYAVTGIYRLEAFAGQSPEVRSRPITVEIAPRSAKEMGRYIDRLGAELLALPPDRDRQPLVQRLMYTCDMRIVPIVLESMYAGGGFWETEALLCYLPQDDRKLREAVLAKARDKGMASGMVWLLRHWGCGAKELRPLIEVSLKPEHPGAWAEGCLAAQTHADDKYTPRLLDIASSTKNNGWRQAVYALAFNRTDESVKLLRQLLNSPDKEARQLAEHAIRAAYCYRGRATGRPLKKDDFPEDYQRPKP